MLLKINKVMIDNIIQQVNTNFNFAYMVSVNILTYMFIKFMDYINKESKVPTITKRVILIISIIIVGLAYYFSGFNNIIVLVNSAIATPVFWSWVLKPICSKFNIDYKSIDETLN